MPKRRQPLAPLTWSRCHNGYVAPNFFIERRESQFGRYTVWTIWSHGKSVAVEYTLKHAKETVEELRNK